jgi:hypothetical protein
MSHFAKVEDGIVVDVIVAEQDFIDSLPSEDGVSWIKTSYNTLGGKHYDPETGKEDNGTPFRKNYAIIGGTYDAKLDAFIPPKTIHSWVLDKETCMWKAPNPKPALTEEQIDNGQYYNWVEQSYEDDNTQGWVLMRSRVY